MKHLTVALTVLLSLTFAAGSAMAATGPKSYLKKQNDKLEALATNAQKNEKKILKIVNKLMDFDSICRESLGKHWDDRSEAEQKEFVNTLHRLIEKNLIKRIEGDQKHKVDYTTETIDNSTAKVTSVVTLGDGPRAEKTEIVYVMKKDGKNWVVVDMVTDGVSLVGNYRSQFHKIITKDGWPTLMQKMKDKLAEQD